MKQLLKVQPKRKHKKTDKVPSKKPFLPPKKESTTIKPHKDIPPKKKPSTPRVSAGSAIKTKTLKISFISCDTDFKNYDSYIPPKKGSKVIRAYFIIENISSEEHLSSMFTCYADDFECEPFFGAHDDTPSLLGVIEPGRKANLALYYEVPVYAKEIEIEFEDYMLGKAKIIFEVK